jgi:hypothetical protein
MKMANMTIEEAIEETQILINKCAEELLADVSWGGRRDIFHDLLDHEIKLAHALKEKCKCQIG